MTTKEWIEQALENKDKLRSLVENWHPLMERTIHQLPITAPGAEAACEVIRQTIRQENRTNPLDRFDNALKEGDVVTLMLLLEECWFGVPESRACWSITGFAAAVDLLDDPPDDYEGEEQGDE